MSKLWARYTWAALLVSLAPTFPNSLSPYHHKVLHIDSVLAKYCLFSRKIVTWHNIGENIYFFAEIHTWYLWLRNCTPTSGLMEVSFGLNDLGAESIWRRQGEAVSTQQKIELDEDGDLVVKRRNSKFLNWCRLGWSRKKSLLIDLFI